MAKIKNAVLRMLSIRRRDREYIWYLYNQI
jgi:hypothetical protein